MTVVVPDPIPLDPPPGTPGAVDRFAWVVQASSYLLGVLETTLRGPAGRAPNWQGDDAAAAGAMVRTLTELGNDIAVCQRTAASRIALHRDRMLDAMARIRALVAQQEDDYAATWARLGALPDPAFAMRAGAPEAVAAVEEFRATEAARGREHTALLAEVADDAAETARVLADCSRVLGGSGRPGDEGRVVAYLALVLPGWGDAELAARGADLAQRLLGQATWEEREQLADEAAAFAGNPTFGQALLAGLGGAGLGLLLTSLGSGLLAPEGDVARVLAAALGAPPAGEGEYDPVRQVLDGEYLRAGDASVDGQLTAAGMALVLAAGARLASGGPGPQVLASWSRQLLRNEHAQDGRVAGGDAVPPGGDESLGDPAALALGLLVDTGEAALVADLLGDRDVWEALLSRFWGDGGQLLQGAVGLAAEDPSATGDGAIRTGLEAIGAGLRPGDPSARAVDRGTVAQVAPVLGAALARHADVAIELLWVGVEGQTDEGADALRGLGVLTLDWTALDALVRSVQQWTDDHPSTAGFQPAEGDVAVPAVGLPTALLAARQYGEYLEFALEESEKEEGAVLRKFWWDHTVGLLDHVPGLPGLILSQVEHLGAIALRMDGTWDEGWYRWPYWTSTEAFEGFGLEPLGAKNPADVEAVTGQARVAFEQATAVLGRPLAPQSPSVDLWEPTREWLEGRFGWLLPD
jgi:hypothetical protein